MVLSTLIPYGIWITGCVFLCFIFSFSFLFVSEIIILLDQRDGNDTSNTVGNVGFYLCDLFVSPQTLILGVIKYMHLSFPPYKSSDWNLTVILGHEILAVRR